MAAQNIAQANTAADGGAASMFKWMRSPDVLIAVAVVGILPMMLFPLPGIVLDFLLALSLSTSLVIMLVSIYITKPLEFGVFPTILLISTLFRLALNVSTTRSILTHGGDASGSMSALIKAFGNLVIAGNIGVGLVIFVILTIINFVVITKGSGRIAEVAARFTLDAMPGKQMAIDAELNAGHINAEEARRRRTAVEKEADFYGAMDGASKFVRGDAIAGIIITLVNMIVGLIVGIIQFNMSAGDAAKTFTLLAVGDGLIAAIPSLMISTAAGLIVTRSTSEGDLGGQVAKQFRVHPKALYVSAGILFLLAVIPGFPKLAFLSLGAGLIFLGRIADKMLVKESETSSNSKDTDSTGRDKKESESIESLMKLDMLTVEVGHALVHLIDPQQDGEVVDRIQSIRKQFAQDLGIVVPQIQLRDNLLNNAPGQYTISLKGSKIGSGQLMVEYYLAMDPGNVEMPISGEPTTDPAYGLPAIWVHKRDKDEAAFRGYTVVNCATVIATHLTKALKEHASELLTRQDVQYLVDKLRETNPKVVEEVIHSERLTVGDVVKVMQNLLREDVSVRDILSLFECLADHCKIVKNPDVLSEQCRKALGRGISQKYLNDKDELVVVTFDRMIEDIIGGGLVTTDNGSSYLNLDARQAQEILQKLMQGISAFDSEGTQPVLLMSARLRQPFQRLVARYLPQVAVLSYDEVSAGTSIRNIQMIS
ncbi:MAG: flagellar biosynthesis protein FlhA [Proteobacteria bacterium]|nr:flagellar biosynthesis protein FlhA [Pseudomonadota bacterium]